VNIAESDNRKIIEREKGLAIFGWIDRNAPFFEVNETYVSSNTSTSKVQYFTSPWTAGGKPNSQTNSPYDCEADKNMAQSTAKSVFLFLHFICWELIVKGELRTSVMGRLGRGWQKKPVRGEPPRTGMMIHSKAKCEENEAIRWLEEYYIVRHDTTIR
jgi:hypothetical protein